MKLNIGKLLGKAAAYVKANPEKVLMAAVLVGGPAARVAAKVAPIIIASSVTKEPE